MPHLDDVVQDFIADVTRYIGPLQAATTAAEAFARENDAAARATHEQLSEYGRLTQALTALGMPYGQAVAHARQLTLAMWAEREALTRVKVDMDGTSAVVRRLGAAFAAAAGGGILSNILALRMTTNVLHWIIMGGLEVLSTVIPAFVALGAGMVGMYPAFVGIYDHMHNLVIASGGLHNALLNSVGPLHTLGTHFGILAQQMAPDATMIFGAAITALSTHFGALSTMAKQAGQVLAVFATKLASDLQGSGGQQLLKFFKDAVQAMTQWGQVLGNFGHAFLNIMTSMLGVGKLFLGALDLISKAFLSLTSNSVVSTLIGVAAAMSAAYRYAKLMGDAMKFLGITSFIGLIRGLAAVVAEFGLATTAAAIFKVATAAAFGPIGIAIGVLAAGLGFWYLAAHKAKDATDQLIARIESAPPTVTNLTNGIRTLSSALLGQGKIMHAIPSGMSSITAHMEAYNARVEQVSQDTNKLKKALMTLGKEYVDLAIGMAQINAGSGAVAAGEQAMAIQTALADSKVQQLNQALDQYMTLLSGGTSGVAAFANSLKNIGTTAATSGIKNLGVAAGQSKLSIKQFAAELALGPVKGAGAWQNFNQVITSQMPAVTDWFRNLEVVGAATGKDVSHATLDMAGAMAKYAGSSKTAQAEVLGFVRAQGLNVKNWPALLAAIKAGHASLGDLARRTDAATIAFSHLSQMAKNTAGALSSLETRAIAQAALKTSGYTTDVGHLVEALQKGSSAGHDATYWYAKTGEAAKTAGSTAVQAAQGVHAAAVTQQGDNARTGETVDHLSTKIKELSRTVGAVPTHHNTDFTDNTNAEIAKIAALQAKINGLRGKNITITATYYSIGSLTTPGPRGTGGPGFQNATGKATGGFMAAPGWATVGENGPELLHLPLGAQVLSNASSRSSPAGNGGGTTVVNHYHIAGSVLARQAIGREVQTSLNQKTFRNGSTQIFLPGRSH